MKKIHALFLSFLLLIPLHTPEGNSSCDGKTLYVGGSGEGNYTTIQDAVFAANDGDTIFVYSGVYHESVFISKRIKLIGENKNDTIIEAGLYGFGINVSCSGVKIKNFSIIKASWDSAAIVLFNSKNCSIESCKIYNNEWTGISLVNADENEIKDCEILKNSIGVELLSSNKNIISKCKLYKNGDGFLIGRSNENRIQECNISNNSWGGVELMDAENNAISDCLFYGNGIIIYGSLIDHFIHNISGDTIDGKPILYIKNKECNLSSIDAGEIIMVGCNNFLMKNCNIEGGDAAIEIAYCNDGIIKNCSMHGRHYGLLAYNIDKCTIESNFIKGGSEDGIDLNGCNNNMIGHNRIIYAENNAISLTQSLNNTIYENDISNNGMGILVFSYSDYNNVSGNHVYSNQLCGISIQGGSYNVVYDNMIEGSQMWCGIAIVKSWTKYNIIRKNNISRNKCGVHLEGVGNLIEDNDIYANGYSIYLSAWLSKCKRNVITKNNFIGNLKDASFEVDILSLNKWDGNYWDNWNIPAPKPIFGYAIIEFGRYGFGIRFPWINFDMHPSMKPLD